VTAYLSVASKSAGFAVILRVFVSAFGFPFLLSLNWGLIFAALAVISMTIGNVAAIPQTNIKRMLGYSSIAQAGYLMVGLATAGFSPMTADVLGRSGILFFLVIYTLTNLGAYGVDTFTPILNPPQSVILGVGRIAPRPAVEEGQLVVRTTVHLSLTFDHRVADGAQAAILLEGIVGAFAAL
jgi:hypothetical protein